MPYPKDNEPRTFGVRQDWLDNIAEHIKTNGIGHGDLLFPTRAGTPISRNTFCTRIWLPAVKASGIDFPVRVHDLRHANASWLLAGGAHRSPVRWYVESQRLRRSFGLPPTVVPPLWHRHDELVRELSALHTHWLNAYDSEGTPSGASCSAILYRLVSAASRIAAGYRDVACFLLGRRRFTAESGRASPTQTSERVARCLTRGRR